MVESILATVRNEWGQSLGKELMFRQDQEGGLRITPVTFSVFDVLISVTRPLRIYRRKLCINRNLLLPPETPTA